MMVFSDDLILALQSTSTAIGGDAGTSDPEAVAELCVDAGRMEIYGYKEAQEEARSLISEFGYSEFLKEAANHVYC